MATESPNLDNNDQAPKLGAESSVPMTPTPQEASLVTEALDKNSLPKVEGDLNPEEAAKLGVVSTEPGTLIGDVLAEVKAQETEVAKPEEKKPEEDKLETPKAEEKSKEEVKPKEKTPSEEIKEAKDMVEALIAFNKNKGFEKPDLMGDFAGKCAEFGKIEDAMHFTKMAVETANSLRNQETQRRMESAVDVFSGGVNRLDQAIENGIQDANKVASRMQESMDQASRAGNAMYQSAEQLTKVANSISTSTENIGDAGRRMVNAAEQIDEASRRMGRNY